MITSIEKRIRIASVLVILGMIVELVSFRWRSPLAFFLFLFGACAITFVGIVIFLISLITVDGAAPKSPPADRSR